ncbi:pyroglutamyl-peptidase I [Rhodopseudomonas sp. HC1]|uniref:pyroglutamyl-peptidase I n=1 Tax=Rhodopseudomonas infernalis TaxID=2897386 RepID=UPI001EE9653C|nr:pyroglutamyl-peptidase I [Rhodopseudomonas infernalis]MCG6203232.1 pyroglutamyl-peptidase I [Rhodopseudomonas infernalis]
MTALRILITGFGSFPGAPYNPTPALVDRLVKLRRPAFEAVARIGHVFPVSYRAVDRELPELLANQPDALLMFGLAARTSHLRIETRARNAVTTLWPDAERTTLRTASIALHQDAQLFGPHCAKLMRAACATGIDARLSRDAGRYLCNYLSWRAIEATHRPHGPRLAAFVHVPLIARDGRPWRDGTISAEHLVDAGEAILLEMISQARRASPSLTTA